MAIFSIRNAKDLGAAIRDRRKALGWDQSTLAKKIGVSRQWIIEIEKGKPRASVELALRALDHLGIQFISTDVKTIENRNSDLNAVFDRLRGRD